MLHATGLVGNKLQDKDKYTTTPNGGCQWTVKGVQTGNVHAELKERGLYSLEIPGKAHDDNLQADVRRRN